MKIKTKETAKYWPFAVTFVLMLIMHSFVNMSFDDLAYATELDRFTLPQYIVHNYTGFSSRIGVNCFLMYITRWPVWIWRVLDSAAFTLLGILVYHLIRELVGTTENEAGLIAASAVFPLIYPFCDMKSAGHVTTTVTYLWPFLCMLGCYLIWQKQRSAEKLKLWQIILWFALCLFAGNSEQCTAIMFGTCIFYFIYLVAQKKKITPLFIAQSVFVIFIMMFILTCPGNQVRNEFEIAERLPEFASFGMGRKLDIGFSDTMFHYIFKPNMIFALFSGTLFAASAPKTQKNWERAICGIPFVVSMLFSVLGEVIYLIFPMLKYLTLTMTGTGTLGKGAYTGVLAYVIYIITIAATIYSFTVIMRASYQSPSLFFGAAVMLGFASHFMLGFSPTIFASGDRAYLTCNMALLIVTVGLFGIIKSKNRQVVVMLAMMATATLSYCSDIIDIWVDFLL